jgi:hypothetical protein
MVVCVSLCFLLLFVFALYSFFFVRWLSLACSDALFVCCL